MTIIEAIKSGKQLRRKGKTFSYITGEFQRVQTHIHPDSFMCPNFFLSTIRLTAEDILATDWEVKPDKVKKSEMREVLNASLGLTGFALDSKEYHMKSKYKDLLTRILENGIEE